MQGGNEGAFVKNAADADQVKEAGRREKFRARQECDDLRAVLATPFGRRLVWKYLEACGVFSQSHVTGEAPLATAFNEGRRSIGLRLFDEVTRHDPGAYAVMVKEARNPQEEKTDA